MPSYVFYADEHQCMSVACLVMMILQPSDVLQRFEGEKLDPFYKTILGL